MTKITGISCVHVKGSEHLDVKCELYPNKPNFLVAPNGSGEIIDCDGFRVTEFPNVLSCRIPIAITERIGMIRPFL